MDAGIEFADATLADKSGTPAMVAKMNYTARKMWDGDRFRKRLSYWIIEALSRRFIVPLPQIVHVNASITGVEPPAPLQRERDINTRQSLDAEYRSLLLSYMYVSSKQQVIRAGPIVSAAPEQFLVVVAHVAVIQALL